MSFPNIPNVTPTISISRTDVTNLLLASVAFEELGLSHLVNAEAEKVQAVLGTLPGSLVPATSISQLLSINETVNQTMRTAIVKNMLLEFKLEDILDLTEGSSPTPTPPTPTPPTPTPPTPPVRVPATITLLLPPEVEAGQTITISGQVFDQFGDPFPGASVQLQSFFGTIGSSLVPTDTLGNYSSTYTAPTTPDITDAISASVVGTSIDTIGTILIS